MLKSVVNSCEFSAPGRRVERNQISRRVPFWSVAHRIDDVIDTKLVGFIREVDGKY